jgi:hypothetical protein
MSDISKMIEITKSDVQLPDCDEYKAELRIVFVGYLSKELQYYQDNRYVKTYDKLINQLKSQVLDTIYKDVISKLDTICQDLLSNVRGCSFEKYQANLELAQRLRKFANELREV